MTTKALIDEVFVAGKCRKRNCTDHDHTDDGRHKIRIRIDAL